MTTTPPVLDPATRPTGRWPLAAAAAALLLMAVIFGATEVHLSGDTWLGLAAGRQIAEQGHVPTTDSFSYTFDGQRWLNQNWLSQLLMWRAYQVSPETLVIAHWGVVLGLFALVLLAVRVRDRSWLTAAVATIAVALGCRNFLSIRAATLGLFCLAALSFLLTSLAARRWAWKVAAPVMAVLLTFWGMAHGSFVFGYAIVVLYVVCNLIQQPWRRSPDRPGPAALIALLIAAAAAAGITIVAGPFGMENFTHPGVVTESRLWRVISEWQSPLAPGGGDSNSPLRFWGILGATMLSLAIGGFLPHEPQRINPSVRPRGRYVDLFDLVIVCGTLAAALWARRFAPFFYILAAPPLAAWLAGAWSLPVRTQDVARRVLTIGCTLGAVVLAWLNLSNVQDQLIGPFQNRPGTNLLERVTRLDGCAPDALAFIARNELQLRLFAEWEMGGPVLYFGRQVKDYIDGRAQQLFDEAHFRRFMDLDQARDPQVIRDVLDQSGTDAVLLRRSPENDALYQAVNGVRPWAAVYGDRNAFLFVRMGSAPQDKLLAALKAGTAWYPETGWGWVSRGWAYSLTTPPDLEKALEALQKGIALDPLVGPSIYPQIITTMQALGRQAEIRPYFVEQVRFLRSPECNLTEAQRDSVVEAIQVLSHMGESKNKDVRGQPGARPAPGAGRGQPGGARRPDAPPTGPQPTTP